MKKIILLSFLISGISNANCVVLQKDFGNDTNAGIRYCSYNGIECMIVVGDISAHTQLQCFKKTN